MSPRGRAWTDCASVPLTYGPPLLPVSWIAKRTFLIYSLALAAARCLACLISAEEGRGLRGKRRWKSSIEALALMTYWRGSQELSSGP